MVVVLLVAVVMFGFDLCVIGDFGW